MDAPLTAQGALARRQEHTPQVTKRIKHEHCLPGSRKDDHCLPISAKTNEWKAAQSASSHSVYSANAMHSSELKGCINFDKIDLTILVPDR